MMKQVTYDPKKIIYSSHTLIRLLSEAHYAHWTLIITLNTVNRLIYIRKAQNSMLHLQLIFPVYLKWFSLRRCFHVYLLAGTSWQLPPFPPAAAGSWGPAPVPRRRRPGRPHGAPGTEGQHPVGSMPAEREPERKHVSVVIVFNGQATYHSKTG